MPPRTARPYSELAPVRGPVRPILMAGASAEFSAAAVSPSAGAAVSAAVSAASVSVEPVELQPANRDATIRQARSSATNFFIIHSFLRLWFFPLRKTESNFVFS